MNAPSRRNSSFVALFLLGVMAVLMFLSVRDESATMDEILHVTAGYWYLSEKDYRLNREYPPFSKDIAAIPLYLFLRPNFPTDIKAWTEFVNDQWPIALAFFYESGNDPDVLLFASRFPIIVLTLVLGWIFFTWVRRFYGEKTAMRAADTRYPDTICERPRT